jgi:hypothetical protein
LYSAHLQENAGLPVVMELVSWLLAGCAGDLIPVSIILLGLAILLCLNSSMKLVLVQLVQLNVVL